MIENLPDGWRLEKMTNLSDILDGDRGKNYPKQEDFSDNDYCLFLTTKNVTKKGFNFDTTQFITKDKDILLNKGRLQRNDLVITTRGTVGNIAFFNQDVPYDIIRINSGMAIIRITTKNLSYSFVNTYFKSNIFHRYVSEIISGSAQPQITIAKLKNLTIPIPPLPQQEKIVKVLDISSALIEKQKELIKNYDLFLKSKFIEMFGDPIKNPFAWEVEKLENLIEKSKHSLKTGPFGSSLKKEFYVENGYKIYGQEQVIKNNFSYGNYYIDKDRYETLKNYSIKTKDILISLVGTFGKIAIVPSVFEAGIINPRLIKVSLDTTLYNPVFFKDLFYTEGFKAQLLNFSHGGTMGILNLTILKELKYIKPPITLQNKFASIVEKIELIKEKENKKLKSLQTLHDSLMQKAFKGEIG